MVDALGIDIGSYKTVLSSIDNHRGVQIVLSESSGKSIPTLVACTPGERLIGDSAQNQFKKNFINTLQFFNRFLGLNFECKQQIKFEQQFTTYEIIQLENKKIGFNINIRGQKNVLLAEQVLGFFLVKLKSYFRKAGLQSEQMVMAVPSYFTALERQAFLDAVNIANVGCLQLINEGSATALSYGFYRQKEFNAKSPRLVAFVDFGHSKLTVTFVSFGPEKAKIINVYSNRNLGARNIDLILLHQFCEDFKKKNKLDPLSNARCRLRMLDAIEKMRQQLTANKDVDFYIESLIEEIDLSFHVKRNEFEAWIQNFLNEFNQCLQKSLVKSGLRQENIDIVELVGEATRIPVIQECIKNVFGGRELQRTLNSQDCIARGCAIKAALLSPNFQGQKYEIEEFNQMSVSVSYKFKNDSKNAVVLYGNNQIQEDKVETQEIFKIGSAFPLTKQLVLENRNGGTDLIFHYSNQMDENLVQGMPYQIGQYQIPEGKIINNQQNFKQSLQLNFLNSVHNIPILLSAEISYDQNQQKTVYQSLLGQTQNQTKLQNQKLQTKYSSYSLTPQLKQKFQEIEQNFLRGDSEILDRAELKNTLEAYSYDIRNNIDNDRPLKNYIDEQTRQMTLHMIADVIEWLYTQEAEQSPNQILQSKIDFFRSIFEPVKQRYAYYSEIDVYLNQFDKLTQTLQELLNQKGNKKGLQEQAQKIQEDHSKAMHFIEDVIADKQTKNLWDDPAFNIEQIVNLIASLKQSISEFIKI